MRGLTDEEYRVLAAPEWEPAPHEVIDALVARGLMVLTHRDETGENYLPSPTGALLLRVAKAKP